jgi:hypothetical protein
MPRWFLSYNSQDLPLMQRLEAALRRKDSEVCHGRSRCEIRN